MDIPLKLIYILLFFSILPLYGADNSSSNNISYSADTVFYSRNDTAITLLSNAQIEYQNMVLTASKIEYNLQTKTMIALGTPVLIDGTDTLIGDYIAYDLVDRVGKVRHGVMTSVDSITYNADRIAYSKEGVIYVENGNYTTCQKEVDPQYNFYSEKIKIIPDDKTVAKPFVLEVAGAPVLALPFFMIPLEKDRSSGWLTPRWRVGINGQGSVDNLGYYWAINDYVDFLAAGKIDNFEDFLLKGESKYKVKDRLSGRIYGDMSLVNKFASKSQRYSLKYNHDQNLTPDNSLTLKGRGELVSDNSYFADYSEDTTKLLTKNISSNLSLTKRFNKLGGYADLTWERTQNLTHETVVQDLPSFRFNLNERQFFKRKETILDENGDDLAEKWYETLRWGYNIKGKQKVYEGQNPDSLYEHHNRGFSHALRISAPFNLFKYLKVSADFNLKQSIFDSYRDTIADTTYIKKTLYDTMSIEDTLETNSFRPIDSVVVLSDTTLVLYNKRDTSYTEVGFDTTYYWQDNYSLKKASNTWWDIGVGINTKIYGMLPVSIGRLQGIRHTFTPSIGYRFIPKKDLDIEFPTIGIDGPRGTKQAQVISFGLNNVFHGKVLSKENGSIKSDSTKKVASKKPTLLNFDINGKYNFEADSQKLSNINIAASVPTPFVDLSYSTSLHGYDLSNNYVLPKPLMHSLNVNPRLPVIKGDMWSGDFFVLEKATYDGYREHLDLKKPGWSLNIRPSFSYNLIRDNIYSDFRKTETYNLSSSVNYKFTTRWSVKWGGTWSFTENSFINQNISLYGDLDCWDLKFDWYPTGVNSGRFYFIVAIKRHREIKWEKRS